MRIRNAAIAGATAIAVAFGGTTVATAQTTTTPAPAAEAGSSYPGLYANSSAYDNGRNNDDPKDDTAGKGSLSSQIGAGLDAKDPANGQALFGSSKSENDGEDTWENQPKWAKALYITTVIGGIAAVLGTIVGPVYNFFVHGPKSF